MSIETTLNLHIYNYAQNFEAFFLESLGDYRHILDENNHGLMGVGVGWWDRSPLSVSSKENVTHRAELYINEFH